MTLFFDLFGTTGWVIIISTIMVALWHFQSGRLVRVVTGVERFLAIRVWRWRRRREAIRRHRELRRLG